VNPSAPRSPSPSALPLRRTSAPELPPSQPELAQAARTKVYLLPIGATFPEADWEKIDASLGYFFRLEIERLPAVELPAEAYYRPRNRYRAEKLLAFLSERVPADARVLLGLTAIDISTTKEPYEDYGILGLATLSGRECVISKFRAKRGTRSETHARERFAKVVVHEVGHTVGLPHCATPGCLMEDARGSVASTDREFDLCENCRKLAARFVVPSEGTFPWSKPPEYR
jgi:archaemetzincin